MDPTALPTVVFLRADKNKYGAMIGKFDKDSIKENDDKFKNGKIPMQEVKVEKRDVKFTDIDCPAQQLGAVDDADDDFDEILAEILAEEKARKEAEEAESGGSKKKKKGKKNKKGGKKKKDGV